MDYQTALMALSGGLLIGAAAAAFLLLNGRLAGISSIVGGLWAHRPGDVSWRLWFILGLMTGGLTLLIVDPQAFDGTPPSQPAVLALGGVLVGLGARIGNGCTSGHGVCGLARRSGRSAVATAVFMAAAMITVYLTNHVLTEALP